MLSNSVLADVVTYVATPPSRSRTLKILRRSVFPARHWAAFQKSEFLNNHLDQFLYDWIAYRPRFELLLDLLRHAKEHLPTFIMKKDKQLGLLDYMIKCSPNPKYMYSVLQEAREGQSRNKIRDNDTWDVINDKLVEVLRNWLAMQVTVDDVNQSVVACRTQHNG